mmetsp:Transcript_39005/g.102185  ORF Transcript_39005/g.102185 Transcript_39005/m.102185 type:complete len:219 (+) Transcript_39005:1221-1877(+)
MVRPGNERRPQHQRGRMGRGNPNILAPGHFRWDCCHQNGGRQGVTATRCIAPSLLHWADVMASLAHFDVHCHRLEAALLCLSELPNSLRRSCQHLLRSLLQRVERSLHRITLDHKRLPGLDIPELLCDAQQCLLPLSVHLLKDCAGSRQGLVAHRTAAGLGVGGGAALELDWGGAGRLGRGADGRVQAEPRGSGVAAEALQLGEGYYVLDHGVTSPRP